MKISTIHYIQFYKKTQYIVYGKLISLTHVCFKKYLVLSITLKNANKIDIRKLGIESELAVSKRKHISH